jgi:regulator of sigma E protease
MSILIIIIGIAVLILIHELGHFLTAKFFKVKVEEFGFGFPPRLLGKKFGETLYSLNWLPFGGFVRLLGESPVAPVPEDEKTRSFSHQPIWKRSLIIIAGVVMNFVLGWLMISSLLFFGGDGPVAITAVVPDSPAAVVGLQAGDLMPDFTSAEVFIDFVNENRGQEITLNIKRGDEEMSLVVVPRLQVKEGEGALGVGIAQAGLPKLGFWDSIGEGFMMSIRIILAIAIALVNLVVGVFTGGVVFESFVGPVGLFQIVSQTGQLGLAYLLQLISLISLNLAVLNIFPFPALDGGRLLFLAIEKIKGSPISPKREALVNAAGFIFLLLLMVAITVKDIVYLF